MSIECYEVDCKYHPSHLRAGMDIGPFCERDVCVKTEIEYDLNGLFFYAERARDALADFCDYIMIQQRKEKE